MDIDIGFIEKMFNIPQESHPEKLWVLSQLEGENKVIYDLGCGEHKTLPEAIGVDIAPVSDVTASIDDLSFIEGKTVDYIISRHSFEHLLDPVKTLNSWASVLKYGGKIIMILPDYEFINTMHSVLSVNSHLHAYTRESFVNLLIAIYDFPVFSVDKLETVVEGWSFGVVLTKL